MKKLQIVGLVFVAMCAVGVLTAVPASAVTFLLAEWLANGVAVTTELTTEAAGELELTDTKTVFGEATILCSFILDGWVGPNSLDFVSEILNLDGTKIGTLTSGTALTCTAQNVCETVSPVLIYPLHLPWEGNVELMEDTTSFLANLLSGTGGNPGWELTCLIVGLTVTDECIFANPGEFVAELTLGGTTTFVNFSEAFTELAGAKLVTCSAGGVESGTINGGGTLVLTGGGELTASSEALVN